MSKSKDAPTLSELVKDSIMQKINEGYNKGVEDAKEVVRKELHLFFPRALESIIKELEKLKKA